MSRTKKFDKNKIIKELARDRVGQPKAVRIENPFEYNRSQEQQDLHNLLKTEELDDL